MSAASTMSALPWRRRRALAALGLGVVLLHAMVVAEFSDRLALFADRDGSTIQRMEVAFVRELVPQEAPPPPVAVAPVRGPAPLAAEPAASAPDKPAKKPRPRPKPKPVEVPATEPAVAALEPPARPPDPMDLAAADAPAPVPAADTPELSASQAVATVPPSTLPASAAVTGAAAVAAAGAASAAGSTAGFEWPPSTQLRYVLKGNYRGEIEGTARVQWVRIGPRYQVELDVAIGPFFAPLMSRHMISQGELGEHGLAPRKYEERTRIGFSTRQLAMSFDRDRAVLANGSTVPVAPGMQDASSQFVQLAYLFTMNPGLLQAGRTVSFPVALPRRLNQWTYDVVGEEVLATPIGDLKTFHLRPRRDSPRQGELVAQAWFAPSLQYLPVRILIHQDAETFIDMLIDGPPKQAEISTN